MLLLTIIMFLNFNSIKVRLELLMGDNTTAALIFQFHKGTIRTQLSRLRNLLQRSNFNSIKVRLEPAPTSNSSAATLFQFHKGTIRTVQEQANLYRSQISIP